MTIPTNNSNNEYTIKGKILNGTTMEPKYPGTVLSLVVSYKDLVDTKTEVLGQCKMDNNGVFEITYKHSKLAENTLATLNFRSSFYNSPFLPKNQDFDTIIYESTWGGGSIIVRDMGTPNSIFWAHLDDKDSMIFGEVSSNGIWSHSFRRPIAPFNIFYDSTQLIYDIDKKGFRNNPRIQNVVLTGDPAKDSIEITY